MPVPRGGGARLVDALVALIRSHGGVCRDGRRGRGDHRQGRPRPAACVPPPARPMPRIGAVIANVTPTQLYGRLLGNRPDPVVGRRAAVPLRPLRDADPLRPLGAAPLGGRRAARTNGDRARHTRPRRRLAGRQRGRARPAAGRGDGRVRAAAHDRPEPCARGQRHPLDPASGAAVAREGRCRRRARHGRREPGRRTLRERYADRIQARLAAPHPEPRVARSSPAPRSPRPTSRRRTRTSTTAIPTAARSRSTRTSSGGRSRAGPGHRTPVDRLWHIGASTWPGPGLGAGSGTIVAQELLKPPALERIRRRLAGAACLVR